MYPGAATQLPASAASPPAEKLSKNMEANVEYYASGIAIVAASGLGGRTAALELRQTAGHLLESRGTAADLAAGCGYIGIPIQKADYVLCDFSRFLDCRGGCTSNRLDQDFENLLGRLCSYSRCAWLSGAACCLQRIMRIFVFRITGCIPPNSDEKVVPDHLDAWKFMLGSFQ